MLALSFCTRSTAKEKPSTNGYHAANFNATKHIAILELFTSQGCSSCPPADRLLGGYMSKENVIPLSFHVDYWDRLGWKDPFSSKEYTQRQYKYASTLNANVYTPQLVINGETEMVGSDAGKIATTLQKISFEKTIASVAIEKVNAANGKVEVAFTTSGNIAGAVANIALVEKKTTTDVKAGENGGATLTNYNVVRNFKTVSGLNDGANNSTIDIPSSVNQKNVSLVVFLQQKDNNKILAGDEVSF